MNVGTHKVGPKASHTVLIFLFTVHYCDFQLDDLFLCIFSLSVGSFLCIFLLKLLDSSSQFSSSYFLPLC